MAKDQNVGGNKSTSPQDAVPELDDMLARVTGGH